MTDFAAIEKAARAQGLTPRGGFHPEPADQVPPMVSGRPAGTLVLFGNVGSSLWESFSQSAEAADGQVDPLNRWSASVIGKMAKRLGGQPHYPFGGPPYIPFLRWAQKAECVFPSPLGMLIHPIYGLWHAYRGALAFAERIELPVRPDQSSPCDSCADRPCLSSCPVSAFTGTVYEVDDCTSHISNPGGQDCINLGCRARRACPVGTDFLYLPSQARLHMQAFLSAQLAAQQEIAKEKHGD